MGLDKAKSLLKVKGNDTFLDLTAKQIVAMRLEFKMKVKFMLMNSFSTSADTLEFFEKGYPSLAAEDGLEMMQNKVPKLDATTYLVSIFRKNGIFSRRSFADTILLLFPACSVRK
jgi:UDP-N-acetylglucosamine pyrophosphorylase